MQNNTFSALFVGQNLVKLPEVDSTNSYLKNLLSNCAPLPEGTVIMAVHQTAGRGQQGNTWHSTAGKNLTFSIYLSPDFLAISKQFELNKAVSLGIVDCLTKYIKEDCKIKWPNDIYVANKKIGGVLIENTLLGKKIKNSIIGIGINVNQTDFEALDHASSLKQILNFDIDLETLLKEISACIEFRYMELKAGKSQKLHSAYLACLFRFQQMADFIVDKKKISGKIVNINPQGELILEQQNAIKSYKIKEIAFVL